MHEAGEAHKALLTLLSYSFVLLSTGASSQVASKPVAPDFVPLDLLSRDRQLSSQAFEALFVHSHESPIELFLVRFLGLSNLSHYLSTRITGIVDADLLLCSQSNVAILVVMHIYLYRACE